MQKNYFNEFVAGLALSMALLSVPALAEITPTQFKLVEEFSGESFFSHFNFETFDDPTHGFVDYVNEAKARSMGLISVDSTTKKIRIAVESKKNTTRPRGRSSVRLTSKTAFTTGLFIIDVNHIPQGNATWPAFWSFGPKWPNSGEIDIIEGKNDQPRNQITLHTKSGCQMPTPDATRMTGEFVQSLDCNYIKGTKGCSTQNSIGSFGPELNKAGGGVFALLWTKNSISVYQWTHAKVPADILAGQKPDPSSWGLPVSYFQLGSNCPDSFIVNHNLVLNTTFCGDWAGTEFDGPDGKGIESCNWFVGHNPSQFTEAYWDINYIKAYSVQ